MRNLLTAPSSIFTLVLFILSFAASVYAREFRQILSMPPTKALSFWKSFRLRWLRVKLGLLQRLHNDASRILLVGMFYSGMAGIGTLIFLTLTLAILVLQIGPEVQIATLQLKVFRFALGGGAGVGAGVAMSGFAEIFSLGKSLMFYEKSVLNLEGKIAKLTNGNENSPPAHN